MTPHCKNDYWQRMTANSSIYRSADLFAPWQVYGMMEDLVAKPGFLAKLENAKGSREQETVVGSGKPSGWPDKQTLDAEWWEVPPPHDKAIMSSETPAQPAVDHQVMAMLQHLTMFLRCSIHHEQEAKLSAQCCCASCLQSLL